MSAAYRITLVSLFGDFFEGPLQTSLLGKAIERNVLSVEAIDPRDFTTDKHRTVDDAPYGGGPGMVLRAAPLIAAIAQARGINPGASVVLLTPQGARLTAERVDRMARLDGLILVCGRYEGIDERVRKVVDWELSIGDYVLSGGEPAALVVIDAVSRHLEGVLGNAESVRTESFSAGLLEYPQYTRPVELGGQRVPDVLLSGDHARIARWRRQQALLRTRQKRPDLFAQLALTEEDKLALAEVFDGRQTND